MDFLPKDIENLIMQYVYQLDYSEKYNEVVDEMKMVHAIFGRTDPDTRSLDYYPYLNNSKYIFDNVFQGSNFISPEDGMLYFMSDLPFVIRLDSNHFYSGII